MSYISFVLDRPVSFSSAFDMVATFSVSFCRHKHQIADIGQSVYYKNKEEPMKAAIVILSDPKNGLEESAGRAFNALSAAYDFKRQGEDVTILFQGAGTRWIDELTKADHPFHALFETVKDKVAGVSCACASVFGATETATRAGYELVKDNPVPGTPGLPSLQKLTREGYTVLSF